MNYAHSILETFEYFCQITSKSIVTILSYTVSKLGRFLRHSVEITLLTCLLLYTTKWQCRKFATITRVWEFTRDTVPAATHNPVRHRSAMT